jgi:hypothetical protein
VTSTSLTTDAGRGDLDQISPPFLPVQRKRKRHIGKQREGKEHEAERMMGGAYERPEGNDKAPMDPDATFM